MAVLLVASERGGVGRSLIAAAVAARAARAGSAVTLARLAADDGAAADARAFALIEGLMAPAAPISVDDAKALTGDVVLEAPAGSVAAIVSALSARVLVVAGADSASVDAPAAAVVGTIVTNVPAGAGTDIEKRTGVLAVLAEDRVLAAPSAGDIAAALSARWLAGEGDVHAVERVMIGTVASDAAEPYFGQRARTCVVTRFDKTDIQLAALQTDLSCLVLTGGGEPSPYLIDRVVNAGEGPAVLLAAASTVESVRAIEGLYGASRFAGEATKLARAVEMLDAAGVDADLLR